jgi:hypothetical protein
MRDGLSYLAVALRSHAAEDILAMGDRLKVVRIHTRPITAEVIKF